jgi:hypothetical protein
MTKRMIWIASVLLLSACGSVTFQTSLPPDPKLQYDEYFDGWGFGFAGSTIVDVHHACPQNKIASIRNYFSVEDILLGILTSGIYTPRTSVLTCALEDSHALAN